MLSTECTKLIYKKGRKSDTIKNIWKKTKLGLVSVIQNFLTTDRYRILKIQLSPSSQEDTGHREGVWIVGLEEKLFGKLRK